MNGLQLNIPQRISLIRVVLTLGTIISIFLSFQLWSGSRSFPHAPVIQPLNVDFNPSLILTFTLLVVLFASLILKWQRLLFFVAFLLSVTLVLFDANRMQHWFYIYLSLLFVLSCYNGRVDDSNKYTSYFILMQLIVASVYFFCGISQLNPSFLETEFPKIMGPISKNLSERQVELTTKMGAAIPYSLIFLGVGLVVTPIRFLAISFGVILHVTLLILLFPSAQNQNYSLWFSNLVFALLLFLLFSGRTKQRYYSPAFLFQIPVFYLVIPLFLILPFTNTFGYWPNHLSSNFISGKKKKIAVSIKPHIYNQLPLYEKYFCKETKQGLILDYESWCKHELKVECNPEPTVFMSIVKHVQKLETTGVKEAQLAAAFH